jgi:pyruvate carboxylase
MKLGLAEQHPPFPPTILVLGEGAVATQIQQDLESLGLKTWSMNDLELTSAQKTLPGVADIDAASRLAVIFDSFFSAGPNHTWVHPGVTVWSERHEFEGWAQRSGLTAICPTAKNLSLFWNQLNFLSHASKVGIPTLGLSDAPLTSLREIEIELKRLVQQGQATLPFVLKSAFRMRGGFGNRVIHSVEEVKEWVPIWMNQLNDQTGETVLFVERYLESARCYAQPFTRFNTGEIELFPIVDGSLAVEGKNWIEVCPAQNLDQDLEEKIKNYTETMLTTANFVGTGILIFLTNGVEAFLVEGLARLNFGYNLWERVARTQALWWQVAALAPSLVSMRPQRKSSLTSAGGELPPICGINLKFLAEDTFLKIPNPGEIHELSQVTEWANAHQEAFLIWDVRPGQTLDWRGNGSIGQLTVFSSSWREVLSAAKNIMKEIWVSGSIQTNERFIYELLSHPWVEESMFYIGFVDEEFIPKQSPEERWLNWIVRGVSEVSAPLNDNESWLWMNQRLPALPTVPPLMWSQKIEFITQQGMRGVKGWIQDGHHAEAICIFPISYHRVMVRIQNWFFSVRRSEKGKPLQLMALTSGRVHSVFFKEENIIPARNTVLIIESLQRLVSHRLPLDVRLKTLKVKAEDEVIVGQELAELERVDSPK